MYDILAIIFYVLLKVERVLWYVTKVELLQSCAKNRRHLLWDDLSVSFLRLRTHFFLTIVATVVPAREYR